jgi:hypothetical protein
LAFTLLRRIGRATFAEVEPMREATLGANMRVAAIAVEGMRRVEVSGREQSLEGERWGENGGEAVLGTLKFQRGHKGKMEAGEGEGEGEGEGRRKFRDGEGREQRAQGPRGGRSLV